MIEVSADSGFDEGILPIEIEESQGKFIQLHDKKLSPIDYKTQILLTQFLGKLGVPDFYVGNHLQGLAKLTASSIGFFINPAMPLIITFVSLLQLTSGQYEDAEGKVIRQVVQFKKEEISSLDQKIVLTLSCALGVFGAHQFYAGKPLEGVLMLCSFGGLGIWTLINIYQIATCSFADSQGKLICPDYIKQSL